MDNDIAIGIDLGTTNSCVAYYYKGKREGKIEVLENSDGDRVTPSFVYFTEQNKVIVGKYAKHMAAAKPEYGIYEIKRFIGRQFHDIKSGNQYFSFNVKNTNNSPVFLIQQSKRIIKKTPVDLSAAILSKIKKDVETKLGCIVKKAVITVPAYFNVTQRQDTLAAGEKAGFTVLKLLNEPTAAALNYYYENDSEEENYSLVYDFGGGTFDVAILRRNDTNIDIVAVDGDSNLGGKDFDVLIIDYVCDELQKTYNYNPKNERRTMRRLQDKCEEAKKLLSTNDDAVITLEGVVENVEIVTVSLTRNQFEIMARDLIQRTIDILNACLRISNIEKNKIKEVILSGGSTRIPKIQTMLRDYFGGKNLNKFVNPDECVAKGAALQAALLSNNPKQIVEEVRIVDVIPLSLGVDDVVDCMTFVINRNSPIPVTKSCTRCTVYNKQTAMRFNVYEGERLNVAKNRFLGTFTLTNVTPAPPGRCEVIFTMTVDHNGILTVTAKEKFSNNVKDLKVVYTVGHRSDDEIKNIVKDAKNNKEDDECFRTFAEQKLYVIRYCAAIKYNLETKCLQHLPVYQQNEDIKTQVESLKNYSQDLEKVKSLMEKIEQKCHSVVQAYNFDLMPSRFTSFF